MATTRAEIRRNVARMLSDYHEATDATGGQTGVVVDHINLARENGYFKGMQILFTNPDSPHAGTIATVTSSQGDTRAIYFEPALASPTIPGETIEMVNFRGRGTTIDQYNAAINAALMIARQQHAIVPTTYAVPDLFDRSSPYIDIPATFVSFARPEVTERDGRRYVVQPGEYIVDRLARQVEVTRASTMQRLHGLAVTLRGYAMPDLLESDDDETNIDLEWLFNEVKAQLLERMVASGMPVTSADRLYLQERREAEGKRTLVPPRAVPNTIRLS